MEFVEHFWLPAYRAFSAGQRRRLRRGGGEGERGVGQRRRMGRDGRGGHHGVRAPVLQQQVDHLLIASRPGVEEAGPPFGVANLHAGVVLRRGKLG